MRLLILAFAALFLASNAAAQIAEEDREAALVDAFQRLRDAPTGDAAETAEAEVWAIWFIGPDTDATVRLKDAVSALQSGSFDEARVLLEWLTAERPDFTEAWNQLAFARFLLGDLDGSLLDIERALAREPRHFGALAGKAQIEMRRGDGAAAARTVGALGVYHPWMARWSPILADPPPPPAPL
ncbi:MAG: hypothetical protein WD969_10380 [Paracoccaceae bacterium]